MYDICANLGQTTWSGVTACGREQILSIAQRNQKTVCDVLGNQDECTLWLIAEGMARLNEDGFMSDEYAVKTWIAYYENYKSGGQSKAYSPPPPRGRTYNWDALSQLGRDIQSGKSWPSTPRNNRPRGNLNSPSCMKTDEYIASGRKTCVYSCDNGQRTHQTSRNGMCPIL